MRSMCTGSTSGSSPCTLITTEISGESWREASATRSVPEAQCTEVMTASPPASLTTCAISSSSVATMTRRTHPAACDRRSVCTMRGLPQILASILAGNRRDPRRAGIITAAPAAAAVAAAAVAAAQRMPAGVVIHLPAPAGSMTDVERGRRCDGGNRAPEPEV